MEKIEQLIQMMEHPEKYSEDQWKDILCDDECRACYQLMSKTDSALGHKDIDDEAIEEEWRRFEHAHYGRSRMLPRRKIAAACVGLALISGIAFAAIRGGWFATRHAAPRQPAVQVGATAPHLDKERADTLVRKSDTTVKTYDNVMLRDILNDLATHYRMTVNFKNTKAANLRLFYQWDPACGIETVTEQLNNFERFHIVLTDKELIVE